MGILSVSYTHLDVYKRQIPYEVKTRIAEERIQREGQKSVERYNRTHKLVRFVEGEEVLVKANSVSSAIYNTTANFFPIFMGPYRIEKQLSLIHI